MKTPVIVTLIIAGAFVIALPVLADAWRTKMLTEALTHGANFAPWEGLMDGPYRFGCFALGVVMIATGVFGTGALAPLLTPLRAARTA